MYTEARDNYRVPGTAGWHYKLVSVRAGQCGLTESRILAWQPAGQKDEMNKKDDMRARRGGRGGRGGGGGGRSKNEHGARTVNLGSCGPPQRAAKKCREPRPQGPEEPRREIVSGD